MVSYARTLCALSLVATCSGGYTDRCNAPWVDGDWRFDIYGDYNCSAAHHHEWFRGEAFDWTNCFELSSKVPVVKSFTYYGHYAITIYKGHKCTGKKLGYWPSYSAWLKDVVSKEGQQMKSFYID